MDELYFEEGYVEAKYFVYTANATAGFSPYFVEGYLPNDYFEDRGSFASLYCDAEIVVGMLMEAQAYFTSQSSLSAEAYKVTDATIALSSEFTQTAQVSRTKDIDLFALSDAAIAVAVSRLRDNNTEASAVFDVATDFVVERSADCDVDAVFSAIISGLRSRDVNLETQAAFSFDVTANIIKDLGSELSSESSLSVSIEAIRNVDADFNSEATASTLGNRIRFGVSDFVSEFAVAATARQIRDAHLTGTGVAAIVCLAVKSVEVQSTQTAEFAQTFLGGKLLTTSGTFRAYASVFVSRNVGEPGRPRNLVDNFVNGLPSFSTTSKFGSHSLTGNTSNFNGGGNGQNDFIVPYQNEDFYIESWYYPITTGNAIIFAVSNFFSIQTTSGYFRFVFYTANPNDPDNVITTLYNYTHTAAFSLNQWYHLSVVKQGNSIAYYINGTRVYFNNEGGTGTLPFRRWSYTNNTVYEGLIQTAPLNRGLIDEAFYYKGGTYGYSTSSTTISVPSAPRQNGDGVVALYHFNNDVNDDVSLVQTANSALTTTTALQGSIGGTFNISADLNLVSQVSAIAGTLNDINLQAFDDIEVTADISVIRSAESEITSEYSQSTVGNAVRGASLDLVSESSQSTDNSRVRDSSADFVALTAAVTLADEFEGAFAELTSRFFTAHIYFEDQYLESGYYDEFETTASKIANGVAELTVETNFSAAVNAGFVIELVATSASTVEATAIKTADSVSLQVSEFTQTAAIVRNRYLASDVTATFTIFCNGVTSAEVNLVAFTNASLSAALDGDKPGSADLTSQAAVYAYTQDSLNSVGNAHINSEFAVSAVGNYIVDNVILTEVVASNLTVAVKSVAVEIPLDSNFTVSADLDRTRDTGATANVVSVVNATAIKTADVDSQISSAFSQSAVAVKVIDAEITTEAIASNLTAVVRIAGLLIACDVVSAINVDAVVVRSAESSVQAQAQIAVDATKFVNAEASIASVGSLTAVIGSRKQFASTISSALTFVVAVRDLRIDEIVYVIPGENWNYKIISETRNHSIYGETRVRSITGESRVRTITGESRIHILE